MTERQIIVVDVETNGLDPLRHQCFLTLFGKSEVAW